MNRAQASTLVFAALIAMTTVATAFVAYRGQRAAFEREFARRLTQLAELAASQVSPADLSDARMLGPDGNRLLAPQPDAVRSAPAPPMSGRLHPRTSFTVRAGLFAPARQRLTRCHAIVSAGPDAAPRSAVPPRRVRGAGGGAHRG